MTRTVTVSREADLVTDSEEDAVELLANFRYLLRADVAAAIARVGRSRSVVHEELARVQAQRVERAAGMIRPRR